jgi:RimJ/RimL family protein N-acetyltransferase
MRIETLRDEDVATLCGWFDSEEALVLWGGQDLRFPLTPAAVEAMRAEGRGEPPGRLVLAGRDDGALVAHGQIVLDHRHGVARLARLAIAPERRGAGLGRVFVGGLVERAFAVPGIVRLELNVFTQNDAAVRLYERLGFVREGVRRSSVRVGDARWNTAIYAIVRDAD